MKTLALTTGRVAIVDDDFPSSFMAWTWGQDGHGYAITSMWTGSRSVAIHLHSAVLEGVKDGLIIDHINGDPLDNRKANLRYCTQKENLRNRKMHKNNRSGYKGVFYYPRSGVWRAEIMADRKKHYLGSFATKEQAALAYNEAAIKLHGEFARLNIIN